MKNKYKPKVLIDGYKLHKDYAGKMYVAVPSQKLFPEVDVIFGNQIMSLHPSSDTAMEIDFPDKFGRGSYTLNYYEWKPKELIIAQ